MKKYILLFSILFSIQFCFSQTNISGIVNSYAAVTAYDTCNNNCLVVSTTTGFSVSDYVLVIQMKGMQINETNTASFGSFVSYDSVGLYEKAIISSISGSTICLTNDLAIRYKLSGKVQIVKIARYPSGATVVGTIQAPAWNGSTGGIIAIEVPGTLTLNANIDATSAGFKGGKSGGAISNACNAFTNITDYATDSLTWEYKSFKGEGVANYVANKWSCRGPQASGGGGGNDHNSGGGGGANLTAGGIGGRNNEPGTFNCKGYQPGLGGLPLSSLTKDRLFLGGGGGSGHQNNAVNFQGGNGGGIIYIRANTLVGNNRWIIANGDSSRMSGQDGGSGGGAGGTIKLDIINFTGNVNLSANGGRGLSTNNAASNRCFGPGGGGSGGAILLISASIPTGMFIQTLGGAPGIVFNSSNGCNGSSNSATAGITGTTSFSKSVLPFSRSGATNCLMRRLNYSFMALAKNIQSNNLQLHTEEYPEGAHILFEKSNNGYDFSLLQEVVNTSKNNLIEIEEINPFNGNNFYKVKITKNNTILYESNIEYIYNGLNWTTEDILAYPNPLSETHKLNIVFPSTEESLEIDIFDLNGKKLNHYNMNFESTMNGHLEIDYPTGATSKMIIIQIRNHRGEQFTKKVFLN